VPGQLPDLRRGDLPACRFAERCERADDRCRSSTPALDAAQEHAVACWHPLGEDGTGTRISISAALPDGKQEVRHARG
jgi:hypothetical protein